MDRLETDADIDRGIKFLCRQEPAFARAAARINAPIRLRRRAGGFDALLKAIVAQQLSVASAAAIWARAEAAGFTQAQRILSTTDLALREVGLSRQKIKYVRALALADVDFDALRKFTPLLSSLTFKILRHSIFTNQNLLFTRYYSEIAKREYIIFLVFQVTDSDEI